MFNPDGCFCCLPPEDPCTTSNCTFLSNEMTNFEISTSWTQVVAASGAAGNGVYTVTNAPDTAVGNDAPSRRLTLVTNTPTTTTDNVYVVCWKKSSSHNPSTQCPVTSLTFCVESKRVSESEGQVRFFIKQNGSTYVTKTGFQIGVNWKRATGTFSQSDFEELSSGAQPNFTATGTAIEFGFGLKIQVNSGDEPFADVWFDNMCVVVTKQCPQTLICLGSSIGPSAYYDQCTDSGWSPSVSLERMTTSLGTPVSFTPGRTVASVANANGYTQAIKIEADTSGTQGRNYLSVTKTGITIDPSTLSGQPGCQEIRSIYLCSALYAENVPVSTVFSLRVAAYQNGCYYGQSSVVDSNLRRNYTSGWTATAQNYIDTETPFTWDSGATSVRFDANSPFELVVVSAFETNQFNSPSGTLVYYIDNICVKATCDTSRCVISQPSQCSNDMEVSFSAPPFPSVLGPHSATLTYFNSVFAGGVVVTRPPSGPEATANPAIWEFTDFGPSPSFPGTDYGIRIQVSPVTSGGTCKFRVFTLAYDRRPAGSQAFLAGTYINWQSGAITDCDDPFTGGLPAIGRGDGFVMSTSCIPTVTPII